MRCRLSIRTTVGALISANTVIATNPVPVQREHEWGIIQGQQWQVEVENIDLTLMANNLGGRPCALEIGFPGASEWALCAQGKINQASASTDLVVAIDVWDPLTGQMDAELPRDMFFDHKPWVSDIHAITRNTNSRTYDNEASGAGVVVSAVNTDSTWTITFTDTTYFSVDRDGTSIGTNISIGSDWSFSGGGTGIVLHHEGWSTEAGAYAVGDTFVFYTSKPRSNLSPVALIIELLESILGLEVYNVLAGASYASPLYDRAATWVPAIAAHGMTTCKGYFAKGTKIVDMVQQLLVVINGGIYQMPTGQLALWRFVPSSGTAIDINGDTAAGDVDIIGGEIVQRMEQVYSSIAINYKHLRDGADVSYTESPAISPWGDDVHPLTIDLDWRVDYGSIQACVNKAISRFSNQQPQEWALETQLSGFVLDIGDPININEPMLGLTDQEAAVVGIDRDPMGQRAKVTARTEPDTVGKIYFRIGTSKIGGANLIW